MEQQKQELIGSNDDGSGASMAKSIINNIIVKIKNVHVRYEQDTDEQGTVSM